MSVVHQLQLQLEWVRAGRLGKQEGPADSPGGALVHPLHPLVVILPWVWAEHNHVAAYSRLAGENGWDALVARWPMLAMWVPAWSGALARSLLQALGSELLQRGERPVVFWCFSGAAKGVYSSLLALLASAQTLPPQQARYAVALLRCTVGQVFDSSPVNFDSDMGRKLLSPGYGAPTSSTPTTLAAAAASSTSSSSSRAAALRAAAASAVAAGVNVTAGVLDFCLLEQWERGGAAMWTALKHPAVSGPVLLLYSRSDHLADAAQIAQLAAALRGQGRQVVEQVWQDSPHVGHLRADAATYSDALSHLLSQALQEWAAQSSRRREGQAWAAGWQQQMQTQGVGGVHDDDGRQRTGPVSSNLSSARPSAPGPSPQQQQLVMQPTRGIFSPGGRMVGKGASSSSSSRPEPATLTRAGTSAASSGSSSCAAAAPMLLHGGRCTHTSLHQQGSSNSSAPARPVVRISSWPATATAVAAAMSADGGSEPMCADSTLLSHSLRCLASSFIATRLNIGCDADAVAAAAGSGVGGGGNGAVADASGLAGAARSSSPDSHTDGQQQQPFMQRVVSRLRSKL